MRKVFAKYRNLPEAVKASLWFTICSILQKGISFITVPIFTRMLSTEEYGIISLFGAWQSILTIFATLNLSNQIFNNGMVKYEKDQDGYTTAMLGLSNFATVLVFVLYLVFHTALDKIFELPMSAIIMMFIGFFFSAATSLWTVHQRYKFKYKLLCLVTLIISLGSALLGVLFVRLESVGLARIWGDTITITTVGLLIYVLIVKKNHKLFNLTYWKYALKLDLPLIPHYLSMTVLGSSDRIMINSLCGKSYTALYSVPYNASMIMQIVTSSINSSFIPWTYQKCKEREYKKLNEFSSILLILVMVITLIPSLFAPELVWLLGSNKYSDSMWVVPPVSCSVFFMFLYSLFSNVELYYEKSKNIMIASTGAAIGNIILNYIFISLFGYIAAAYTTLVCYIFLSVLHYVFMMKICREQQITEPIYNVKLILALSIFLIIYSVGVTILFDKPVWIRYGLIIVILLVLFLKRKLLLEKLAIIKNKR